MSEVWNCPNCEKRDGEGVLREHQAFVVGHQRTGLQQTESRSCLLVLQPDPEA